MRRCVFQPQQRDRPRRLSVIGSGRHRLGDGRELATRTDGHRLGRTIGNGLMRVGGYIPVDGPQSTVDCRQSAKLSVMDGFPATAAQGLLLDESVRYEVRIRVHAAYDPMEITREDLERDLGRRDAAASGEDEEPAGGGGAGPGLPGAPVRPVSSLPEGVFEVAAAEVSLPAAAEAPPLRRGTGTPRSHE